MADTYHAPLPYVVTLQRRGTDKQLTGDPVVLQMRGYTLVEVATQAIMQVTAQHGPGDWALVRVEPDADAYAALEQLRTAEARKEVKQMREDIVDALKTVATLTRRES